MRLPALFGTFTMDEAEKVLDITVQQQKEFMVNASHELRTPLTIIRTEFETFLRNKNNYMQNLISFWKILINHPP